MQKHLVPLQQHFETISLLASAQAVLEWDERTGMPEGASEFRANQLSLLSGMIHERRTDPKIRDWLDALDRATSDHDENSFERSLWRNWKRDYDRDTQLPAKLVQALTKAIALGQHAWGRAKSSRDFAAFLPNLKEIIQLKREEAAILAKPGAPIYDALLDQYEEGLTSIHAKAMFDGIKQPFIQLIQATQSSKRPPDGSSLQGRFPQDQQIQLCHWIAEQIGFDFHRGRLDITEHPFCTTLGPSDHRILTRYFEDNFTSGFFGTLHEAGHGMYEQGLPTAWYGMPPGQYASLGVHESQSRLWENMVGRSQAFWEWCLPHVRRFFPTIEAADIGRFYRDINRVSPSLIRVEADEATYNLHVLIRFEIEAALFANELEAEDLPLAWNERYTNYLGVTPSHDGEGVLQDVHWSAGLFGYFPTYTLGNIYAAQLMIAAEKGLGSIDALVRRGAFQDLLEWLRTHIHTHGRRYRPSELVEKATGEPIQADHLVKYLTTKLNEVYGL